ncbi:hypothetical protein I317_03523 [Kwoniella heveanensis CBS 569]|uniref:DUF6534 domain-containing protein n=1 Tax=Kwoniella heveanensis BCC8398 TaxID=1296120 RepID=A0A1B9GTR9_9TREE|nr:hypothetical protein I316_03937 [Kwoniella heveanensis BCC8398]OCF42664.1 hypothetical protein I317_03523 [Kwoniella heveanensis CBS 569]
MDANSVPDIKLMPQEQVEGLAQMALANDLGYNLGPWLLGVLSDCIFFGILAQQYISWFSYSRPNERPILSWLTHYIGINQAAWTGYIMFFGMHYFVFNFGAFRVFLDVKWASLFPTWGWSVSGPIKFFYIERTWKINGKNMILGALLCCLNLAEGGMCFFLTYKFNTLSSGLEAAKMTTVTQVWQGLSLASDMIITTSLAFGLYKSRTGWSQTDHMIKKLMFLTIETQMGPTVLMLAFTIQFAIAPPAALSQFFDLLIPKAYALGYLATLNSRYNLRRDMASSKGSNNDQLRSNTFALGSHRPQQATVHVDTETYSESYNMPSIPRGTNRGHLGDLKEISDVESVENLDYTTNLSKQNLNKPSIV